MKCLHPNVKLTISWTVAMDTTGPEVIGSAVENGSLRVSMACPDCQQCGNVWTAANNWRERWPTWLLVRIQQLARSTPSLRQAVRTCLPGLVEDDA